MKKLLIITLSLFSQYGTAWAHTQLRDASTLIRGILPNERLDPSSVTLQGNRINFSTVASGVNDFFMSSNSLFMSLDGSTQVKTGGATIHGNFSTRGNIGIGLAADTTRRLTMRSPGSPSLFMDVRYSNDVPMFKLTEGQVGDGYIDLDNDGGSTRWRLVADGESWYDNADTEGFGINTQDPSSLFDVVDGSITVRGTNSGLRVSGLANKTLLGTDDAGNFITGSVSVSASVQKTYDVVVGTPGMPGMDFIVLKSSDLWAPLTSIGANGLTTSATGQGTILFVGGPFEIRGATVPAGVTFSMIKGSSWGIMPTETSTGTIITVYGKLDNFVIDLSSIVGFTGSKVVLGTGCTITNLTMRNGMMSQTSTLRANLLFAQFSASFTVDGLTLDPATGKNETVVAGDNAAIYVDNSRNFTFKNVNVVRQTQNGNNTSVLFGVSRSSEWALVDSQFNRFYGDPMVLEGGNYNFHIDRNLFRINGVVTTRGAINFNSNGGFGRTSTGTISYNEFIVEDVTANNELISLNNLGSFAQGINITGNRVTQRNTDTDAFVFVIVEANTFGTVLRENTVFGRATFISDSGAGTKYSPDLGNFVDNIEQ